MAICYECGRQFYGNYCPHCGWEASYSCWSCGEEIDPQRHRHCPRCGWFTCPFCKACGCDSDRPPSLQEEREFFEG